MIVPFVIVSRVGGEGSPLPRVRSFAALRMTCELQ